MTEDVSDKRKIVEFIDYEEQLIRDNNITRSQLSINLRKAAAYLVIVANSKDLIENLSTRDIVKHVTKLIFTGK